MDGPADQPHSVSVDAGRQGRRRGPAVAAAAGLVAIAVVVGMLLAARDGDVARPVETRTANDLPAVETATSPEETAGAPMSSRVQLDVPAGWQTLHASGERLVVATHPLAERDLQLALLARPDAVFASFPPGGAVFVVGSDRMQAKYTSDPAQAVRTPTLGGETIQPGPAIGPGPELGLGPATSLPGGVTVRRGDVPRSVVVLAAYSGSQAPAEAMLQMEAMAAAVRLRAADRASVPPPPPGSRPGFDSGGVPGPEDRLRPVGSVSTPGITYTIRADGDCGVVTASIAPQPVTGGCAAAGATGAAPAVVSAYVVRVPTLPPPPGQSATASPALWPETMLVLVRSAPGAGRLTAALVDGRTVEVTAGTGGWGLVATDGRAFLVEVRNEGGEVVAQAPVP